MFRTVGDQPSLWESLLPEEVLRLPAELALVDALLDDPAYDPAFFAPFARFFDPLIGRPSTPVECYLRQMFLKVRYRLGYENLCQEVADSISWRRFCRIPIDGKVRYPTKLTSRCGEEAVAGLNEALWAKAAQAKLLRTARVRADTTVISANVAYPTDVGLLAKAVGRLVRARRRVQAAGRNRTNRTSTETGKRPRGPRLVRAFITPIWLLGCRLRVCASPQLRAPPPTVCAWGARVWLSVFPTRVPRRPRQLCG